MGITLLIEVIVIMIVGILSIVEGIRLIIAEKIQLYDILGPGLYNVGMGVILIIVGLIYFIKTPRKPRSVNGDEWWFRIGFRKLPVFREAVKPRLVGGDRSHGATFFTSQRKKTLGEKKPTGKESKGDRKYKIMMMSMIVIMIAYIFLIYLIGYLFASVIFFFLINRVAGFRSWKTNLVATIIMAASYYLIFVTWMGMIFPRGVLLNF